MVTPSKVVVRLYGHGNIQSFKNKKRIARGKRGPLLITRPDVKKRMDAIIQDLTSLFLSEYPTSGYETLTGCSRRSLILSLLPEDDSRHWIPRIVIECSDVPPGEEGVDITIERISPDAG